MDSSPAPSVHQSRGTDPASSLVRALAVVGVIFGTLGLTCLPFNLGSFVTYGWPVESGKSTQMDLWCLASTFIQLGLSTLLFFSSLGAYHFKWWGRYGLLFWACSSWTYGVLGVFFWGRFLTPALRNQYADMRGPDEVAGLITWVVGTGLAIFVLLFLARRSAGRAFDSPAPPRPYV